MKDKITEDTHPDLFSDAPTRIPPTNHHQQSFKDIIGYHRASQGEPQCQDCSRFRVKRHSGKKFFKCKGLPNSNSTSTDIAKSGTCLYHTDKIPHYNRPEPDPGQIIDAADQLIELILTRATKHRSGKLWDALEDAKKLKIKLGPK